MRYDHARIFTVTGPQGLEQLLAFLDLGPDELLSVKFRVWSWTLGRPVEVETSLQSENELTPERKRAWNAVVSESFQSLNLEEVEDMLRSTGVLEQMYAAEIAARDNPA